MSSYITKESMEFLREHIGREVKITWVQLGKEMSSETRLYRVIDFATVNSFCMIGWNMAVRKVEDVETGKILFKNPIIKSDLYWNSSFMMWWLRIRSYGLGVTVFEVSKTTRQCIANRISARFRRLTTKKIKLA